MTDVLRLSWVEFNVAVAKLAPLIDRTVVRKLYGVPRGGLCIAVALSHATGIPLELEPGPGCAIIDDIADTGKTLRELKGAQKLVWVLRPMSMLNCHSALKLALNDDRWVLFPWEQEANADKDRDRYAVRGL